MVALKRAGFGAVPVGGGQGQVRLVVVVGGDHLS